MKHTENFTWMDIGKKEQKQFMEKDIALSEKIYLKRIDGRSEFENNM